MVPIIHSPEQALVLGVHRRVRWTAKGTGKLRTIHQCSNYPGV